MASPAATPLTGRRGLWRWSVAMTATAALVVSGSGLVVFAQSGEAESQGPQFVPADAPIYIEARLDMPDGQQEALAELLTAFPGFADPGSFDMKMDELLAGLGGQMGVALPEGDLFGDVLTGEIGIAVTDIESAMVNDEATMLMGMAVADASVAGPMLEALTSSGAETTEVMYGDTTVVSDGSMAAALHGDWVLLSNDEAQVTAAIDVLDGEAASLADDPDFTAAFSRLPSARLAAAYMNLAPFGSLVDLAGMMAEGQAGVALPTADLAGMLPQNMTMYLAAENDRLTLETFITPGEQTPAMPVGESDLATLFPADTQLYIEARELGAAVEAGLTTVADMMASEALSDTSGAMSDVEMLFAEDSPITSMLGVPLVEYLDFVSDASVGAGLSSDGLWLGIAAEVTDEGVADDRVGRLLSLLRLMGASEESGITISDSEIGGFSATTITLPEEAIAETTGGMVPIDNTITVAVAGEYLLIGLGDYVETALTMPEADTLASSAGYVDALAGDSPNTGVLYANISSLLTALDPMISMMVPEWADIAPYATGVDRLIAVGTADDEVIGGRMTVIVGQ